jgi:hypothetical protein
LKKSFLVVTLLLFSSHVYSAVQISDETTGAQYDALVKKTGASYIGSAKPSAPTQSPSRGAVAPAGHHTHAVVSAQQHSYTTKSASPEVVDARSNFQKRFQEIKSAAGEDVVVASTTSSDKLENDKPSFAELAEQYRNR